MTQAYETPRGLLRKSTLTRRFTAGLTDLFSILLMPSAVNGLFFNLTGNETLIMVLGVGVISVVIVFYFIREKLGFRSPGEWALGLMRFRFSEIVGFGGRGIMWCVEDLESKEWSKRTMVIITSSAVCLSIIRISYPDATV